MAARRTGFQSEHLPPALWHVVSTTTPSSSAVYEAHFDSLQLGSLFSVLPSLSAPSGCCCCSWRFHRYPPPCSNTHPLETSASPALPLPLETKLLRSFCLAHRQALSSKPIFSCTGPSHVPSSCFLTQILLSSVPRGGSKPMFKALYVSYPISAVLNPTWEFCFLNLCLSLSSSPNTTPWYTREQNTSLTFSVSWGLSTNLSHRLTASKYSISSVFLKKLNFFPEKVSAPNQKRYYYYYY